MRVLCTACAICCLFAASLSAQRPTQHEASCTVEGRVLGPLGEPMIDVEVWAAHWPDLDTIVARTHTDGEGMFVLGRLPPRSVSLFATAPGYTVAFGFAMLSRDQTAGSDQLRLWEANTLRGRVVDADGRPVAGAVVVGTKDFTWFDGRFRSPETRTDAEGSFVLPGVPIGDCVVRAWAAGYVTCEHQLVAVADADVEIRLVRGDGVRLTVQTAGLPADARAATRVQVHATRGGSGFTLPSVFERGQLDGDGRWQIAGLPDAEWNVEPSHDDYTFDPRSVRTEAGQPRYELTFHASRIGSLRLSGRLLTDDGRLLAGENLVCRTQRSPSMNGGAPGRATTDAEGRFTLDAPLVVDEPYSLHLVESQWVLAQEKGDGHTGRRDARYLVRYEDRADPERELALVAVPAAFVTARLVDTDDQPVPFVWTELQAARGSVPEWSDVAYATSRRDGSVAFPGVHGLEGDLTIHAAGGGRAGRSEVFRIERGARRDLVVRMQRAGRVVGRVLDARGEPLPGVRVVLRNYDVETGRQTDGGWTHVPTDRLGRFAFIGVPPGGHRLHVELPDRQAVAPGEIFAVAPGATVRQDLQTED